MTIKIIPNTFYTPIGIQRSWGIIVNGIPKYTYYDIKEVESFLRGLNGKTE